MLYIDCSYVSSGDKISSMDECLVPLGIGPSGPILDDLESSKICKTLQVRVRVRVSVTDTYHYLALSDRVRVRVRVRVR
jgi:hypothetical protein